MAPKVCAMRSSQRFTSEEPAEFFGVKIMVDIWNSMLINSASAEGVVVVDRRKMARYTVCEAYNVL